jgi:hypothetical protein
MPLSKQPPGLPIRVMRPTVSLFVYVIGPEDEAGLLKIGRAVDVQRRLAQLKGMSPVPLTVLWSRETDNTDLESKLHRYFASYRRHGEWFDFQGSDWRSLIDAAAEELESGAPLIRRPRNKVQLELPPVWREFQLTDGQPEWALDESEPCPSAAPRCPWVTRLHVTATMRRMLAEESSPGAGLPPCASALGFAGQAPGTPIGGRRRRLPILTRLQLPTSQPKELPVARCSCRPGSSPSGAGLAHGSHLKMRRSSSRALPGPGDHLQ